MGMGAIHRAFAFVPAQAQPLVKSGGRLQGEQPPPVYALLIRPPDRNDTVNLTSAG
jgi:hypothetical protein